MGDFSESKKGEFPVNEQFHVLLVEDDNVTLRTVEQLLRKYGHYRVTTASNGREAMRLLSEAREHGRRGFDLVLTDLILPEVSGFDLIHEVVHGNNSLHDVPVVVMSSQDSQESVLQAFEAGAADYLIKPLRKNEVATLWQHVWRANRFKAPASGTGTSGSPYGGEPGAMTNGMTKNKNSSGASTSLIEQEPSTLLSTGYQHKRAQQDAGTAPDSLGVGNSGQTEGAASRCPELFVRMLSSRTGEQQSMETGSSCRGNLQHHVGTPALAAVHLDIKGAAELLKSSTAAGAHLSTSTSDMGRARTAAHQTTHAEQQPHAGPTAAVETAAVPAVAAAHRQHHAHHSGVSAYSSGSSLPPPVLVKESTEHAQLPDGLNSPKSPNGHDAHVNGLKPHPTRPHAKATSISSASGVSTALPLGLQELAAIGHQREQEHQHSQQQQQHHQVVQQQQQAPTTLDGVQATPNESSLQMLRHSDRSAFTALTVFLPRPAGAAANGAAQPGVPKAAPASAVPVPGLLLPMLPTMPLPNPVVVSAAEVMPPSAPPVQLERAPPLDTIPPQPLVLPPPLQSAPSMESGPQASDGALMGRFPQPAPGAVYLPDSVIQLICALTSRPDLRPAAAPMPPPQVQQLPLPATAPSTSPTMQDPSSGIQQPQLHVNGKPPMTATSHRQAAVAKYLEKRKRRNFQKKVRYESRKRLAEARPRVRGQFVKQGADAGAAAKVKVPASPSHDQSEGTGPGPVSSFSGGEQDAAEALAAMAGNGGEPSSKRARMEDEGDMEEMEESEVEEEEEV
mmetsp:Transcript_28454/g.62608  ORF Transcript_28454/g.62608 Transcript_28454/m.62608 type:complete len:790 (+) Transcript_28454:109-2478(+)|eukprot:CAMPEP_0202891494 /NCGR_PEP_ID=MMETSP1392-20130828/1544_1 /ASSEMBLY_ACC=CAM_ASM_000868 /TAXON_ID=225041 /ORGANISM="Chlamydomonas chlamydogama, Strain SAG 11-48b" /LENGTH=789 /DNA_ID=CAMNT_0049575265 /DNA_START=71 /DNA_END=2440 /DNA_ORIENTATION=-